MEHRILDLMMSRTASARGNLGESREVDGQQAGGGFLAAVRGENNRAILLEGDRGLLLVHHLQLRAHGVEHDLVSKERSNCQPVARARERDRIGHTVGSFVHSFRASFFFVEKKYRE